MITVRELFEACIEYELTNARVYAAFMIRLGVDDERAAQFWEEMSSEEWEHYIILNFGRSLCERAGMMGEPARNVQPETLEKLNALVSQSEERAAGGRYTLKEAFQIAIALESSEVDYLFLNLIRVIRQAINRLGEYHLEKRIQEASGDMRHHLDSLVAAIRRLGNDPELVREARDAFSAAPAR